MSFVRSVNAIFNKYLSWIVLLVAVVAFMMPSNFIWAAKETVLLLQIIMFGMGLTLSTQDFVAVFKQPWQVFLVSFLQFAWMPISGVIVSYIFNFPPEVAIGFILLGACPGGTASNVMTYLARGDVPLSVTATSVSTMLAPFLTPLFVVWYGGAFISISFNAMFLSIVKIVVVPIVGGLVINYFFHNFVKKIVDLLPTISTIGILLVIAGVVAINQKNIMTTGVIIFVACVLQNLSGYAVTYGVCKALGTKTPQRRAMQIEVGMQNSGLAASLAMQHFSPQAAIAGAVFSIVHNFTGSIFAAICRANDTKAKEKEDGEAREK